jgi:hypothetical protein
MLARKSDPTLGSSNFVSFVFYGKQLQSPELSCIKSSEKTNLFLSRQRKQGEILNHTTPGGGFLNHVFSPYLVRWRASILISPRQLAVPHRQVNGFMVLSQKVE